MRRTVKIWMAMLLMTILMLKGRVVVNAAVWDEKYNEYIDSNSIVVTLDADSSDITKELKDALNESKEDRETPYVVVIPMGNYTISSTMHIYSNTTLYAVGATITRMDDGVCVSTGGLTTDEQNSGYKDYQNINIIGGKWIRKQNNYSNIFYLIHGKNINVLDCTLDGGEGEKKANNHLIEASAIDGLLVKGCTFQNNIRPEAEIKADTYCGGYECLQLDITAGTLMEHNYKYDGTPSKNVTITDNVFKKASRGIGSHTAIDGVYIENISITNNIFDGLTDEAVVAYHYYNCKINNNTITGGRGICVQNMGKASASRNIGTYFLKATDSREDGIYTEKKRNNVNTEVKGNTIVTSSQMKSNCSYGIEIYGATIPSGYKCAAPEDKTTTLPAGNYEISGVTVTNNTITTNGVGIRARGCYDSVIQNNTIQVSKDAVKASTQVCGVIVYGGGFSATKGVIVSGNTIGAFRDGGVFIKDNSFAQDIVNNSINGTKGDGIRITDKSVVLGSIGNNVIKGTGESGIVVKGTSRVNSTIDHNSITGSKIDGIRIVDKAVISGSIMENKITSVKGQGIVVKTKAKVNNIENNTVASPKGAGVLVADNGYVSGCVQKNTIKNCNACGIDVKSAKIKRGILKNTITGSRNYGLRIVDVKNTIDVISNKISGTKKGHALYVRNKNKKYIVYIINNIISGNKNYMGIRAENGNLYIASNRISNVYKPVSLFTSVSGALYENTIKSCKDRRYVLHVDKGAKPYVNGSPIKKVKVKASGSKKGKVTWKSVSGVDGYTICYSTSKDMANAKSVTVKGKKGKSALLKKLKTGKVYYVRVYSYVKQDGMKVYSKKAKTVSFKAK